MDFDKIRILLNEIVHQFEVIQNALDYENKMKKIEVLEAKTLQDGFWDDPQVSSKLLSELKQTKAIVEKIVKIQKEIEEAQGYLEIAQELNDNESFKEAEKLSLALNEKLEKLEIDTLLSEEYDHHNALLSIHPGAGGTESQDWALMLYRMFSRWCSKNEYEIEILDLQEAMDAGIKSVTILVKGENAYGYLKSEIGVHRLVRISPFDANSRRHTSFAAVEVLPEIADDISVDIKPEEIEMDVYRASGAGGQHVNKTSSAVRLKHIPSGIVVTCQTERSQLQNREYAMKMLRAKLYQKEQENYRKKMNDIKGESTDNAWGNQIRSYVFCPYTLVKDHRTNYETGNIEAVMDGNIDKFIYEYLKYSKKSDII